jgi:hypothetical protein
VGFDCRGIGEFLLIGDFFQVEIFSVKTEVNATGCLALVNILTEVNSNNIGLDFPV